MSNMERDVVLRLHKERYKLLVKMSKLRAALNYEDLVFRAGEVQESLMHQQYAFMVNYEDVLRARIEDLMGKL